MEGGGAERAMANLLHYLMPHLGDHKVELVLLDDLPCKQDLPDGIDIVRLKGRGKMLASRSALARHWATPEHCPDICLSFLARANTLNVWLTRRFGHRALISERVNTSSHLAASRAAPLLAMITRVIYPRADHVVAVSEGVAEDLIVNFNVTRRKISVIGNAIDHAKLRALAEMPTKVELPDDYFLGLGRLVPNKNFALFLKAYAQSGVAQPVVILGQGPEDAALKAHARELGIQDRIHFAGFVDNPYPAMARARALVSSSRAEGFPNTLIEAMSLGCPVIATDCPSGPSEVLQSAAQKRPPWSKGASGILIEMEDHDAMAKAIRALCDPATRDDYAARAKSRSATYGVEPVINAYLSLIFNVEKDC
ncbi:MAG: glycosyltransferase [Yoonia sp.]